MSDDLLEWLRAQLDDDERVAHEAACANPGAAATEWSAEKVDYRDATTSLWGKAWGIVPERVKGIVLAVCPAEILPRVATHIARHDPARALRAVAAKRKMLAEHERAKAFQRPRDSGSMIRADEAELMVRIAAEEYADRPGYREEWRP